MLRSAAEPTDAFAQAVKDRRVDTETLELLADPTSRASRQSTRADVADGVCSRRARHAGGVRVATLANVTVAKWT